MVNTNTTNDKWGSSTQAEILTSTAQQNSPDVGAPGEVDAEQVLQEQQNNYNQQLLLSMQQHNQQTINAASGTTSIMNRFIENGGKGNAPFVLGDIPTCSIDTYFS